MLPPVSCSAASMTGLSGVELSALRPCSSICLARIMGACTDDAMRSTEASSNTISARSGVPGSPTMLLRAVDQFTTMAGTPRSDSVAGALNSAISSFGS